MSPRRWALLWLLMSGATVIAQAWGTGALSSELGAYSDEPAHYVTGVMVRDYLPAAHTSSPLEFASAFYDRYPKVALGNWPPGFYLMQLPWLLLVGDSPQWIILWICMLTAFAAALLSAAVTPRTAAWFGAATGAWWLSRPLTMALAGAVMTEVPLALATMGLILGWGLLLGRGGRGTAAWGGLAGLAVLIKSSAGVLALLPLAPTSARLPWRRRVSAFGVCLIVALPWTLLFRDQARAGWLYSTPTFTYSWKALGFYGGALVEALGAVCLVGLASWAARCWRARAIPTDLERLCALATGAWLALLVVVPAGLEARHLLPATIATHVLAGMGLWAVVVAAGRRRVLGIAVVVAAACADMFTGTLPTRAIRGYASAIDAVSATCGPSCTLLVVSDPQGEGSVVAEATARRRTVPLRVVRGSKVLSESDWAGRDFRPLVRTVGEARRLLVSRHITHVLLDDAAVRAADRPAGDLVARALLSEPTTMVRYHVVRRVAHPRHDLEESGELRLIFVRQRLQ